MAADVAGKCDVVSDFELAFDHFDEVAQALGHANGSFIHVNGPRAVAIRPNPVPGRMSRREVLELLIAGTPLRIMAQYPDRIDVEPAPTPSASGRR